MMTKRPPDEIREANAAYKKRWRDSHQEEIKRYFAKRRAECPERGVWLGIKSRCFNPKNKAFMFYGGRGITICEKWKNSLHAFIEDVGRRPDPKLTIERIDNDGNYEPGNVRWATKKEQALNTRSVRLITIDGTADSVTSWARRFGLSQKLVETRLSAGWDFLDAISAPPGFRKLTFRSASDDDIRANRVTNDHPEATAVRPVAGSGRAERARRT